MRPGTNLRLHCWFDPETPRTRNAFCLDMRLGTNLRNRYFGNAFVIQVSPDAEDVPETLCSLAFASRVNGVQLGPCKANVRHPTPPLTSY